MEGERIDAREIFQEVIMKGHDLAIPGDLHIDLDNLDTFAKGQTDGFPRILDGTDSADCIALGRGRPLD